MCTAVILCLSQVGHVDEWISVEDFMRKWKLHRGFWKEAAESLCIPLYELRYEDLLSSPAEELRKALSAMNLMQEYSVSDDDIEAAVTAFPPAGASFTSQSLERHPSKDVAYVVQVAQAELEEYGYLQVYLDALSSRDPRMGNSKQGVLLFNHADERETSLQQTLQDHDTEMKTATGNTNVAKSPGRFLEDLRSELEGQIPLSIVLTVHDQEPYISEVLEPLFRYTRLLFELIVVFDGCQDDSEEVVDRFVKNVTCEASSTSSQFANSCTRYTKLFTE